MNITFLVLKVRVKCNTHDEQAVTHLTPQLSVSTALHEILQTLQVTKTSSPHDCILSTLHRNITYEVDGTNKINKNINN